jgi:protein gp37
MSTTIEWTEETWNPVRGCSRISPGCEHCYAERIAARFGGDVTADGSARSSAGRVGVTEGAFPFAGFAEINNGKPRWTGRVELIPEKLTEPLRWRKPRRVFVNSMSDLFHENLTDEAIDQVFAVMALCPQHTFQVLTKRAKRMREWFERKEWEATIPGTCVTVDRADDQLFVNGDGQGLPWPLLNVHLGVSVESQKYADERIPELLATPAAVRWVSAEPLLEAVDFSQLKRENGGWFDALDGKWRCVGENAAKTQIVTIRIDDPHRPPLDWVVVGGESGPGARPFDLAWARSIIAQCRAADVPVFMKQLGSRPFNGHTETTSPDDAADKDNRLWLSTTDRKGGKPSDWPSDLRVREYQR